MHDEIAVSDYDRRRYSKWSAPSPLDVEGRVQDDDFEPLRLARGIIVLAPRRAEQVTLALMADATKHGDHGRAAMWSQVLAQVRALLANDRALVH